MTRLIDICKCFVALWIALWAVDVLVNLLLCQETLLGNFVDGTPGDYAGLLLLETQIAAALVGVSAVTAAAIAVVSKHRWVHEFVVMLGASVSGFVMLAATRITWGFALSRIATGLLLALGVSITTWVVLRLSTRRRAGDNWRFGDVLAVTMWAALAVAFANQTIDYAVAVQGMRRAALSGVSLALALLVVIAVSGIRARRLRTFFAWLPVAVALVLAVASSYRSLAPGRSGETTAGGGGRPDIVLIVLDTARADHLARYGYARNTMPRLEDWAKKAAVFMRAVSPAGWTEPSHASMFSGRPVSLHGLHYAGEGESLWSTTPYPGVSWLPARLGAKGYYCLAVSANDRAIPPVDAGFDRVITPTRPRWLRSTMAAIVDDRSPLMRRVSERMRWRMPYVGADRIVDIAMKTVPDGDGPVFLFVNVMDTHSPYNPPVSALRSLGVAPKNDFLRYRLHRSLTKLWPSLPDTKTSTLIDLYDGELRWMDTHVARLLEWVDERFGGNAVVIVTSDHGEELGEEGRIGHEFGLAQSIVHVPLMIAGRGIDKGVIDEVVTLRKLDTVIESLADGTVDIRSLFERDALGVICERYPSAYNVRTLGREYGRPWVGRFDDGFKAVGPSASGFELLAVGGPREFDRPKRVSDPDIEREFAEWIDDYWETYRDRREESTEFEPLTEEDLRILRSLGYID